MASDVISAGAKAIAGAKGGCGAQPVVGAWKDSEYLERCRIRAAELRETGACQTPLVAPDNRHCSLSVAANTRSKGRDASRDRGDAVPRTRKGAIRAGGWGAL